MKSSITDVKGITVGCAQDLEALTGCTVILTGPEGAVCGVDIRGAAPGSRETALLNPVNTVDRVHGLVLAGGSAYGLDAASGVMQYLEEQGVGFPVEGSIVPIVPAAVLFDLPVGRPDVRPDRAMGYLAAGRASQEVPEGNAGAGAGATIGKLSGFDCCTKSGQGSWSVSLPSGLVVGAIVAVNAVGDVIDPDTGQMLAGLRDSQGGFISSARLFSGAGDGLELSFGANTTIAAVATNARLDKAMATRVAMAAHDGMARAINPAHTIYDGDTVFALATGEVEADLAQVCQLAAEVLARAILRAVRQASSIGKYRAMHD